MLAMQALVEHYHGNDLLGQMRWRAVHQTISNYKQVAGIADAPSSDTASMPMGTRVQLMLTHIAKPMTMSCTIDSPATSPTQSMRRIIYKLRLLTPRLNNGSVEVTQ